LKGTSNPSKIYKEKNPFVKITGGVEAGIGDWGWQVEN